MPTLYSSCSQISVLGDPQNKTKQEIQNLATHIIQKHYFYTGFGEPKVIVSDPPVENHCSKKYNLVPYLSFQLVLVPSYYFDLSELFVELINIRSSQHLIGELVSWKANDQFAAFNYTFLTCFCVLMMM